MDTLETSADSPVHVSPYSVRRTSADFVRSPPALLLVTVTSVVSFAQTAVVEGIVVDKDLGEGLPGANVIATGTATGTATASEGALLASRARAAGMSDAVSAKAVSRSRSSDAAAAMSKVTGASVVSGKYVYVRGLGDRCANTHLNDRHFQPLRS